MNDDKLEQAAEDIALIKSVLERTTVSFSTLRPAFSGLAVLWLVYALAETAIWIGTLFTSAGTRFSLMLNACSFALQWLLCAALLVFTAVWRKRLPNTGVDPLASRLAGMWGVFLLGYVLARVLELALFPVVFRIASYTAGGEMVMSGLQFRLCNQVLSYATTITFAVAPILLSAVFFRSRSVGALGLGALVAGLAWSVIWLFVVNNKVSGAVRNFSTVLYWILQFLPSAALFLFSGILKNHNITVLRRKKHESF